MLTKREGGSMIREASFKYDQRKFGKLRLSIYLTEKTNERHFQKSDHPTCQGTQQLSKVLQSNTSPGVRLHNGKKVHSTNRECNLDNWAVPEFVESAPGR